MFFYINFMFLFNLFMYFFSHLVFKVEIWFSIFFFCFFITPQRLYNITFGGVHGMCYSPIQLLQTYYTLTTIIFIMYIENVEGQLKLDVSIFSTARHIKYKLCGWCESISWLCLFPKINKYQQWQWKDNVPKLLFIQWLTWSSKLLSVINADVQNFYKLLEEAEECK